MSRTNPVTNRIGVIVNERPRHFIDRNLPGHWENIRAGQTADERQAAILVNVKLDEAAARRGIDRATGETIPATELRSRLAKLRALTR